MSIGRYQLGRCCDGPASCNAVGVASTGTSARSSTEEPTASTKP